MLPWSWVTRACSLNFKCSQPDNSFPYCDGGGEGFEGQSLLQYTFQRELKIRVFACFWRFCRKMCCPTKSSLLPLTLIHISLAPLCLAAVAAALRALQQVFLLSGTPPGPLEEQCSVSLMLHCSLPSLWASPWSCLGRSLHVWSGEAFLHDVFNCHLLWA